MVRPPVGQRSGLLSAEDLTVARINHSLALRARIPLACASGLYYDLHFRPIPATLTAPTNVTESDTPFEIAAIVLCGGESSRMGFDKFRLPLNGRTFLEYVVEKLATVVDGPIIAAASERTVTEVTKIKDAINEDRFQVVVDERNDSGPMEGIRMGLGAAGKVAKWAFVTSCDVPLICPEVLGVLQDALKDNESSDFEATMPTSPERIFGMTAIYRCSAVSKVVDMVARRQLRVSDLATELNTKRISVDEIRKADPELDSMKNLNSPSDYLDFLRQRGFDCPTDIEQLLKTKS